MQLYVWKIYKYKSKYLLALHLLYICIDLSTVWLDNVGMAWKGLEQYPQDWILSGHKHMWILYIVDEPNFNDIAGIYICENQPAYNLVPLYVRKAGFL